MAGTIKVKYKHIQPVILRADMMEEFKEAINGQDISGFFREIQEDVVEKHRQEKKELPPIKGAIINYTPKYKNVDKNQVTLDLFAKEKDITKYIVELKEKDEIAKIKQLARNGQLIHDMAATYFKKVKK